MKKSIAVFVLLSLGIVAGRAIGGSDAASNPNNIFVQISRKMIPSVVNIFTTSTINPTWKDGQNNPGDPLRKFFEDYFGGGMGGNGPADPFGGGGGMDPGVKGPKEMSLGSGFIIEATSSGALILTNNHVIENADEIKVKFTEAANEKETDAEIVGTDPDLDVALLRVKTKRKLQAVTLGDSDHIEVGEWVAALGNPFGHGHSVSHGIISAKERALPGGFGKYIQTDAPINPGNSGGPMVNLEGEVVGINNAIDARGPGIGFAIPISQVKMVLNQLKTKGKVERGYIGINVDELQPDLAKSLKIDENLVGPIVTHVVPGEPADKAGLKVYDVITEVDGKEVQTPGDLVTAVTNVPVGNKVKIKALRMNKSMTFEVTVAKRPEVKNEKIHPKPGKKKSTKPSHINTGMTLDPIDADVARDLGLPDNYKGIVVSRVAPGGPAYQAGLGRGDVILEVDRKPVKSEEDFYRIVSQKKTYLLRVRKQDESGHEVFVVITLNLSVQDNE